jgi:CRP/FNR family transcriptional regulator
LFDTLTDEEVDSFTRFLVERRLAAGETLFREGDLGASLFVLLHGDVAVEVPGAGGERVVVGRLVAGDVLGEQACLDPAPRSATITAITPSVAVELTRAELDRMSRELPRVASLLLRMIIQGLTERLRSVDRRIESELQSRGRGDDPARRSSVPPQSPPPNEPLWQRLTHRFRGAP